MLEKSAQLPEALDAYQQALARDHSSPFLYVRLGATQVKLGRPEQALKSFQRALELEPSQPDALRWLAMLYASQGNTDEAIRAYRRLAVQQPTDRFVLSTLADLYVLQGQLGDATTVYEQLIREFGSSYQLHFNLGILNGRLGRMSLAIQELSRALELAPESSEARVALGLMYEMNHQMDRAIALYEDAMRLDPLNPRLYHHAARAYSAEGKEAEAIHSYQAVLDLAPADLDAIIGLVRIWMAKKQFQTAQEFLGSKLQGLGNAPELYLVLGLVYQEAKAPQEAIRAFQRAIDGSESFPQAHFYLGAQLERLHREEEAKAELHRCLELDPNYADALNYLGYMNAEQGISLHEAKSLIERALAIDPDNGAYVDSLGWVYYQLGELEEAVRQLERAVTLVDTDATIFDHLGDAYVKQGQIEKAEQAWQHALQLDQSLGEVKRKLDTLRQHGADSTESR